MSLPQLPKGCKWIVEFQRSPCPDNRMGDCPGIQIELWHVGVTVSGRVDSRFIYVGTQTDDQIYKLVHDTAAEMYRNLERENAIRTLIKENWA